jgi:hypothetical protein
MEEKLENVFIFFYVERISLYAHNLAAGSVAMYLKKP